VWWKFTKVRKGGKLERDEPKSVPSIASIHTQRRAKGGTVSVVAQMVAESTAGVAGTSSEKEQKCGWCSSETIDIIVLIEYLYLYRTVLRILHTIHKINIYSIY